MAKCGEIVTITFKQRVPADCTDDELVSWARFMTMENGSLSNENPLIHYTLSPESFSVEVT